MTVSTTTNRVQYNGDGSSYIFAYTFRIIESSHLYVIYTDADGVDTTWTENNQYSVTNVGEETGGNVVVEEAYIPADGTKLTLYREVPETQETDYVENDPFHADTVETDLDRTIMIIQQLSEGLDGCIQISTTDNSNPDLTIPSEEDRAGKLLGFDEDGDVTVYERNLEIMITTANISDFESAVTTLTNDHTIEHHNLNGLTDDDHTQYTLANGSRAFTSTIAGVTPTSGTHLVTKEYVDAIVQGLDWQASVLSKDTTYSGAVSSGTNRYISPTTSGSWIANYIYQWNTTTSGWTETVPLEGYSVWVEDLNQMWTYNSSDVWVQFGGVIDHGTLIGLADNDHPQYVAKTMNANVVLNGYCIDYGSILSSNGTYVGEIMTVTVDDASSAFGKVLCQGADFHYDRADADSSTTAPGFVIALESGSGSKKVLLRGQICSSGWSFAAGKLYLSGTIGDMTTTPPSGAGQQIQPLGWALSATTVFFSGSITHGEAN
jgi:hypothetical protein